MYENIAVELCEKIRWGDQPKCPWCECADVYTMRAKTGGRESHYRWRCRGCKRQFTVRTGTMLEDSRVPMLHWLIAFQLACGADGVTARDLRGETGMSFKSARFVLERLKYAAVC